MNLQEVKELLQDVVSLLATHVLEHTDIAQASIKTSAALSAVSRMVKQEQAEMQSVIDMNLRTEQLKEIPDFDNKREYDF